MSPADMLALSSSGQSNRLQAVKSVGPTFDPLTYIETDSYVHEHPNGFEIMGSQLQNHVVGVPQVMLRLVQIDVPRLAEESPFNDPFNYARVTPTVAFPVLGPVVGEVQVEDSVYVVRLSSTFPSHDHFERRVEGGSWENALESDVLPVGACRVEYRSVDALGHVSGSAVVDVWAPRAQAFLEGGNPGGPRPETRLCS